MHPSFLSIDSDLLRRLYLNEQLTADEIATRLRCSPITVLRRLGRFAIPRRRRGPRLSPEALREAWSPSCWSASVAWAVGVIATDGNLGRDGRHLTVTSKDRDLLDGIRKCLRVKSAIAPHNVGRGASCSRLQWSNPGQHAWLREIGLTPAKSLTLGPLAVPDTFFVDFFRGCIDGDGSIVTYVDRYNTAKKPTYIYTRLYVSLVSASLRFVEWLRATVRNIAGAWGDVEVRRAIGRNDIWRLRYAKAESLSLLRWMYYAPDIPCLRRKRDVAEPFLIPRQAGTARRPGRPMVL
jgi:hypothetical protein